LKKNNSTKNVKPNQQPISVYVSLIYPDKDETIGPFLIYQTTDANVAIKKLTYGSALTSSGYICILALSKSEKITNLKFI